MDATHGSTFASLGVPEPLTAALAASGIDVPFPIQTAVVPDALAGADILGRGKTGSGKTLGFCIPMAARLAGGHTMAGRPRGLVLVPTRELANQVQDVLRPLARAVGLKVATIFGGTPQRPQVTALRNRVDIIVACPGRLADLIGQGHCHLGDVEISVVDEADHMSDLGFLPVVRRLLDATPPDGQRMLFSATLDHAVDVLVRRFLDNPAEHAVDPPGAPAPIVHHLLTVVPADRVAVIAALAAGGNRSLIFTRTKHGARKLARQLTAAHIPAAELHGNLTQGARERNLARVRRRCGPGTGRHRHRRPRHPRGRHRSGHPRRPARRAQGLPAPLRPDRPGRRQRHRDNPADPRTVGRRAHADAQSARRPARRHRQARLRAAAFDSRASPNVGTAAAPSRCRGGNHHRAPGNRAGSSRHVVRVPRPAAPLTRGAPRSLAQTWTNSIPARLQKSRQAAAWWPRFITSWCGPPAASHPFRQARTPDAGRNCP